MIYIGYHLSVTNGYEAMGKTMCGFGGNTFAYFTRNPRGGRSKDIIPEDAAALNTLLEEQHFGKLVAHGSYTMNLCAAKESTRLNGLDIRIKRTRALTRESCSLPVPRRSRRRSRRRWRSSAPSARPEARVPFSGQSHKPY